MILEEILKVNQRSERNSVIILVPIHFGRDVQLKLNFWNSLWLNSWHYFVTFADNLVKI